LTCPDYISKALTDLQYCVAIGDSQISVATHCLYPDGGGVSVVITNLGTEFMVSDGAGAYETLSGYSKKPTNWDRFLNRFAAPYELKADACEIVTEKPVSVDDLPATIILVANASKEAADTGMTVLKLERLKRFREVFDDFVEHKFSRAERIKNFSIAGESNKQHRFDYAISLANGGKLLTDPVAHDGNAINAKVVSHLDVKHAKIAGIFQRLVYDDRQEWPSSDLHLLKMSAETVPFSKADQTFVEAAGD